MELDNIINLAYVIAATLFVFGIKMLGSAETARRGNMISGIGMLIAVVVTLLDREILDYKWIVAGLIIGASIGGIAARVVKMTSMPELVALFNGFGGFASLLVAWAELEKIGLLGWQLYMGQMGTPAQFSSFVIYLAMLIGGVTFTGSLYAYGKLSGRVSGRALVFGGQKFLNILLLVAILGIGILFTWTENLDSASSLFVISVSLALVFGVMGVMAIGG
ncbi:MAG: NAD(P)(+) transhydrogenase (Re/Si-specific) subunit beta, partial [Opitutales bacterium]|nr:NAD(P)(+) transhydrogenase (Re/Si-specific) subunit beta [Opitutales bacterium]